MPELLVELAEILPATYDPDERDRLCALHRSLGVSDEDHVVRPIVHRDRAVSSDLGVPAGFDDLEPELTVTADGASTPICS